MSENAIVRARNRNQITRNALARRAEVSEGLIYILEMGGVTHPKIAERIAKVLRLNKAEKLSLMPECWRGVPWKPREYVSETAVVAYREPPKPQEAEATPDPQQEKKKTWLHKGSVPLNVRTLQRAIKDKGMTQAQVSLYMTRNIKANPKWLMPRLRRGVMQMRDLRELAQLLGVPVESMIYVKGGDNNG